MAGRPKIFDNEEVINKAIAVFWSKGYEATSTEDLLEAMGIGKGSFYLAFKGGKKELFEKVLEQFRQQADARMIKELANSDNPLDVIRNLFYNIAHAPKKVHHNGCFFGNTIVELASIEPQLMNKSVGLLQQLEDTFREIIIAAQKHGQLKNSMRPDLLAKHLITAWNGLNVTRRMYPDEKTLLPLIEIQLQVLT
ncbi:TetR/AcrR family transcriptional regulator [Chitinophaga flava]|uniref:TetR/AcrR family transcriptional regulator n=1 Tax=Chitinophaga flava TaxID=2259036 RepID=A0A365XTT3_9BACT|nr:TetR/AcrR family transcriptional regulator [Chitinophaga flava]RBL89743.1 TetR/AcrR family transcriptional regulator [Chitinophaga flava]